MAEGPASLIALRLGSPADGSMASVAAAPDVAAVAAAARAAGDLDRAAPIRDGGAVQEVHWGGRLQRAVVRSGVDEDGAVLLRTEVAVAPDGLVAGLARQAALLGALARHVAVGGGGPAVGLRDLSARVERDLGWLDRAAAGTAGRADAVATVVVAAEGRHPGWVATHGAARLGLPDLELYGLPAGTESAAVAAVEAAHDAVIAGGMGARLALPDGTPLRLVPVLEAWADLPLDWPGIGRAGAVRGPGLDGPRATLSVLHRPRLGRYRRDVAGVVARLTPR